MVHLGDTASFLRVVRIYVKKDELLLRIRKSLGTWSLIYSRLVERQEWGSRWETRGVAMVCAVRDKCQVPLTSWSR